ncbi:MAG TPA: sensor histidine kinase [Acidimicrobiales bacterium]|nr:sensor histidine kinase [Acidimicrobiales bacterium]
MPEGAPEARAEDFQHEARFYSGVDEFLAATVPFLLEGLEREEPMFAAVPPPQLDALRAALPDGGAGVALDDVRQIGRNPAHLIPAWHDFVQRNGDGARPVRGIAETMWPGRSRDEIVECQRHESLLNVAFADCDSFRLLCPYNVDALPDDVLDDAERSHPWVGEGTSARRGNPSCRPLETMGTPFDSPLPAVPDDVPSFSFGVNAIGAVRELCARFARAHGLQGYRADDLVLAVHELASNSVRHAGGHGVIRLWQDDDRILCEVADNGHIDVPLAGRLRPEPDRLGGRGLWMANQLCDLVQIRTTADGNVVRLHQRLSG